MPVDRSEDKRTRVQAMFTAIAERYDLINSLLSLRRDGAWRRFVAAKCPVHLGGLALDVATGTGELARHLVHQSAGGKIIGVDFCPRMLARARAKLGGSPHGNSVQLVLGDALQLPFPDNTFNCVTIGFGLRNVTDIGAAFLEMARVAKPGAQVVSLELTRPSSPLVRALHSLCLSRAAAGCRMGHIEEQGSLHDLPESIREFKSPEEVARVMADAGLGEVETHRLTLGIATVHAGTKQGQDPSSG